MPGSAGGYAPWDAFFDPAPDAAALDAMRAQAWLPGSLAYHWHNR